MEIGYEKYYDFRDSSREKNPDQIGSAACVTSATRIIILSGPKQWSFFSNLKNLILKIEQTN